MIFHIIRISVIILLLLICSFLPFLPGSYDALAVMLSSMAQLAGIVGLLFVPIGLIWLIHERVYQAKKHINTNTKTGPQYYFIATLIVACIMALAISLAAFANGSRFLGIIIFVLSIYTITKSFLKLKRAASVGYKSANHLPIYLICLPTVVFFFQYIFIPRAIDYSRDRAIRQSEALIQDIEAYHQKNGQYPLSLLSLWEDYHPTVIGIERYYYEPYGKAYNLCFEQFSNQIGVREIVMYNKLDEQVMTSHNNDLLELSPEQLNLQRGFIGVYPLPHKHWKYFWFD